MHHRIRLKHYGKHNQEMPTMKERVTFCSSLRGLVQSSHASQYGGQHHHTCHHSVPNQGQSSQGNEPSEDAGPSGQEYGCMQDYQGKCFFLMFFVFFTGRKDRRYLADFFILLARNLGKVYIYDIIPTDSTEEICISEIVLLNGWKEMEELE